MGNESELRIVVKARDAASSVLKNIQGEMGSGIERAAARAKDAFLGFAKYGAVAAAGAATAATTIGFKFNSSVEQAQAQIMAFTKDAGRTAQILAYVKDEAAKTQFSFTDMA